MATGDKRVREEEVAVEENGDECAICLESNFSPENPLRTLPCKHKFDLNCLRTLNNKSAELKCPMCRKKFKSTDYEPPPPPPPQREPEHDDNGLLLYTCVK